MASYPAPDNPAGLPDLRTPPALPVLVRVTAPADRSAVVPAVVSVGHGVREEIPELEIATGETAFLLFGFWRHEQGRLSGCAKEIVAAAPEGAVVHDRRSEFERPVTVLVRAPADRSVLVPGILWSFEGVSGKTPELEIAAGETLSFLVQPRSGFDLVTSEPDGRQVFLVAERGGFAAAFGIVVEGACLEAEWNRRVEARGPAVR